MKFLKINFDKCFLGFLFGSGHDSFSAINMYLRWFGYDFICAGMTFLTLLYVYFKEGRIEYTVEFYD